MIRYLSLFVAYALLGTSITASPVAKPLERQVQEFPDIWQQAGPQKRLLATRAAELDGDRLLMERIYGLEINRETSIGDLAVVDDSIAGAVKGALIGAVSAGPAEYLPDGRVQVIRAVKVTEIVESIEKTIKSQPREGGKYPRVSDNGTVKRAEREKVLEVLGNAALPESPGHDKVRAKRAAELDAYQRLAGRLMGVRLSSSSTVRDFCLQNDALVAALSHTLKAAKPTAIEFGSDGTCQITMEIKVADIVRTTRRYASEQGHKIEVSREVENRVFSEKGSGLAPPTEQAFSGGTAGESPAVQTDIILREVLKTTPVTE